MRLRAVLAITFVGAVVSASPAFAEMYLYKAPGGALKFSNAPVEKDFAVYLPTASTWYRNRTSAPIGSIHGQRRQAFDKVIHEAASRHGVDEALVKAVIRVESDFHARAVSPKGARGLMQLMPATARRHRVARVFEPSDNVDGGVRHLNLLIRRYNGNLTLALAAYNAGEGAVDKYGGIPPYRETQGYVTRVLAYHKQYLGGS